ncbi:MAG: PIN domain-containing protein [Gammaproteobacteria bacterium]|nr:PIN domain-containing protein [Gammaproteobacteria bacterium]
MTSDSFCTSIVVACGLGYGSVIKGSAKLTERVELILNEIDIQPLTDDVSKHCGMIRTRLKQQGQIIGANDLLIAAHCLALNATLVTANYDEFSRVEKNWLD